jgi:mannitol-1-/sugar-/sorbitol-6-/2-deoxyglucose-6-phosphatase
MIQAVIFDMDGLLIDSEPLWQRTHRKIFKKVGVTITPKHDLMMLGHRTNEAVEIIYRDQPWSALSQAEVTAMITEEIINLIRQEGLLKPGVHQALFVCKQAGLPVAIASSSPQAVIDAVVDTLEIRKHFKHIYSAEFEEYGKPHPAVFLKVAKHFKVSPKDCLVLEDSPAGVLAAKAAKMVCIAVPEDLARDHSFIRTADMVLGSLEEFEANTLTQLVVPKIRKV